MVLPEEIGDCAQHGDQDRIFAWLDAGGDINDGDPQVTFWPSAASPSAGN